MLKTSLTLVAIAISSQAFADDAINKKLTAEEMEHVVVSGSRVFESIDEVPASVTIISQKQIEEHLKVNPELQSLLAQMVPGLAPDTGSSSNTGQSLRGRAPLVMIDGVPQSTPLRNGSLGVKTLDPSAIARIEVIKGATSVYGNGASGGIINYITKQATSDGQPEGEISLSSRFSAVKLEESAGARVSAAVNGRADKISYLFTASYEENGVQRDAEGDILGLQYGLSDAVTENYFTKLGYDFDDEKQLQFSYNYFSSQQKTDLGDVVGNLNDGEKTYAIHVPKELQKQGKPQGPDGNENITLKYTDYALFTNTQMTLDLYMQNIENVFFFSTNLANPDEGYEGGQSIIRSEKKGARATFNTLVDFDNVEATFIYGLDALNDVTSQPLVDGRVWVPEMDMESLAGFLQTKWVIDNDLVIKAGVRQESIDLTVDDYNTLKLCRSETQCSVPLSVKGDTIDYDATTYNVGVKYNLLEAFSPFANYSQGSDISDIGRLLRSATVNDIGLIQTEASIIDNYEIGFTSQFDDLRFEFAAYRSTSEFGTTNSFNEVTGVYEPVRAPQEIWGYETLVDYKINPTLKLVATYSYVEGKNTEEDIYLGSRQISPPKGTANLNWQPNDELSLTVSYLYVGSRKRFEPNADGDYVGDQGPISSYNLFNLSGRYNFSDNWQAFMGVENLFNNDYYPARAQSYTYGGYNIKGLGTTVTLGATYSF
ncbi:TonB-dependent receptor [Pseudoalteromonas shioyasakiensis]|uniref:TonB-dependent receptor n=1 Tax=Pseudoalteromonas shioyasakiensis TaxID=1190813 RepID=A0ABT6TXK8_9GAMM|nr:MULTISPECIES: TonB-dependent receptor [Pseudoalteromonas]MDI4668655.1 TonB-dependent receptor [Pseudoalteromonas shioyasakiensis]MDI4673780.1 TonB-dependent receptor [Pseudoalteromonas shioyasakiensis]MDI4685671.1 TonB-dependent receptor [Pseudoalteromonas shioyasakiensis]MDI4703857.1 TonB-dependent receptor [Pseudoalteromonas shioyasakiensis]NUJ20902.1 TonB-dependent receptor [Pseudoalteromonas sp. 0802]